MERSLDKSIYGASENLKTIIDSIPDNIGIIKWKIKELLGKDLVRLNGSCIWKGIFRASDKASFCLTHNRELMERIQRKAKLYIANLASIEVYIVLTFAKVFKRFSSSWCKENL